MITIRILAELQRIMKQKIGIHRRNFIRTFTFATAYSSLFGSSWSDLLVAQIIPSSTSTGTLRIKLSDFPALASESGSVRLGINPLRGNPPMPNGQFYPIIINRGPNNTFFALNSRCTHQSCVVDPLDSSTNQMNCPCHGSVFGIDGRRVLGPATAALSKYTVKFNGTDLVEVQIPTLGYSITASNVQSDSSDSQIRLNFRALRNVDYQVEFRESIEQSPTPIPFSTTPTAPAEQTVFTANANSDVSLYVPRTAKSGFYMISVVVTEI